MQNYTVDRTRSTVTTVYLYLVQFVRYSTSNDSVPLKSGLGVIKVIENVTIQ